MPLLKTYTLGCKVNQYETEYLRQGLLAAGYRDAAEGERADLCIVNTCTVTLEGDYKSRKLIRALARDNPGAGIVVMGCYATRAPGEVAALPGVVEVLEDKRRLPEWLAAHGVAEPPRGIAAFPRLHRALVKVQDGCTLACSYCIIPSVRPRLWSRPIDETVDEVRRLAAGGHREIVLTGIHLGLYGAGHGPGQRLSDLLARLLEIDGDFRIRLSSLEAGEATPELLALMAARQDRICPHLHLPLQSGSDRVLQAMRRPGTAAQIIEKCRRICEQLDRPSLTTDAIVGFPGETEADFEDTCRVVEAAGFSKIHVFRYSARDGTPAAALADAVPPKVKHRRAAALAELSRVLAQRYCQSLVGRELQVLVEGRHPQRPGWFLGTADRYVPVEVEGPESLLDRLVAVRILGRDGEKLLGRAKTSS